MRNTVFLLLGMIFMTIGCKKEEPTPEANNSNESNLEGVWIEGSWQIMTTSGNDTTWTNGEYVGDGYNNGVTTVNVTGNNFVTGEIVSVDGIDYTILDYISDGESLDDNYRYWIELKINTATEGCKYYLELFKRTDD
jgi:hypothetical protein